MDFLFLSRTNLFRGTTPDEVKSMLSCLNTREKDYKKGSVIFRAGDVIHELGLVIKGSVSIENDDLWGNKTILDYIGMGQVFAESYACVSGEELLVNVVAASDCTVLFLDVSSMIHVCSKTCSYHTKLISNLLAISSMKNLNLARRSFHTASKSIRGRLLSYLSYQVKKQGKYEFDIPFNRQELADYLNVDRSALSNELGKMHREGYLTTSKNHFVLSKDFINLP